MTSIFRPSKLHRKSTWKRRGFLDQRNYIENVRGNDVEIRQNLTLVYISKTKRMWLNND